MSRSRSSVNLIFLGLSLLALASACKKKEKSQPAPSLFKLVQEFSYGQAIESIVIGSQASFIISSETMERFELSSEYLMNGLNKVPAKDRPFVIHTESQTFSILPYDQTESLGFAENFTDQSLILTDDQSLANGVSTNDLFYNNHLLYAFSRGKGLMVGSVDASQRLSMKPTADADIRIVPTRMLIHNNHLLVLDFNFGLIIYSLADINAPTEVARLPLSKYNNELLALNDQQLVVSTVHEGIYLIETGVDGDYKVIQKLAFDEAIRGLTVLNGQLFAATNGLDDQSFVEALGVRSPNLVHGEKVAMRGTVSALSSDSQRGVLMSGTEDGFIRIYRYNDNKAAVVNGK